jgi:hypothetical protein
MFTPWPLYSLYPLDGHQSRSGHYEEEKIFPLPEVQYLNLFQVSTLTAGENPIKIEVPNRATYLSRL